MEDVLGRRRKRKMNVKCELTLGALSKCQTQPPFSYCSSSLLISQAKAESQA